MPRIFAPQKGFLLCSSPLPQRSTAIVITLYSQSSYGGIPCFFCLSIRQTFYTWSFRSRAPLASPFFCQTVLLSSLQYRIWSTSRFHVSSLEAVAGELHLMLGPWHEWVSCSFALTVEPCYLSMQDPGGVDFLSLPQQSITSASC